MLAALMMVTATACPATSRGAALRNVTVYDGPIAENAILRPDDDRRTAGGTSSRWQLGYVYRAGREVFVACSYPHRPDLVVQVARPVRQCVWTERGRTRTLACR